MSAIISNTVATRTILSQTYLDWLNNYASIQTLAEHYGLSMDQARKLIDLSREVYVSKHPDA